MEGSPDVPEALWDEYREPLLTPEDLGRLMPEKSARTIRRELEAGRWPVIELSERVRRVRARDLELEMAIRAGGRAVRKAAGSAAAERTEPDGAGAGTAGAGGVGGRILTRTWKDAAMPASRFTSPTRCAALDDRANSGAGPAMTG